MPNFTVKNTFRAMTANGMAFGLHSMACVTEFGDSVLSPHGAVVLSVQSEVCITSLNVRFHLAPDEARTLAALLKEFADLADAKCAELTAPVAA